MTELEALVEEALYQTVRTVDDKKSIVLDTSNGLLYFKKILAVYKIPALYVRGLLYVRGIVFTIKASFT